MALPKDKKQRRKLVFWIQAILLLVAIGLFIGFKLFGLDIVISGGLVGGLTIALFETCLRWVEEGK